MKTREIPFCQEFDIIVKKEQLILDYERDKYPGMDKKAIFFNGTTGKVSTKLEDVLTEGRVYIEESFANAKRERLAYSTQYVPEDNAVIFHLLVCPKLEVITEGGSRKWVEFSRFVIDKHFNFYLQKNSLKLNERGNVYSTSWERHLESFKYEEEYTRYGGKPFLQSHFEKFFSQYVNRKDGSRIGFMQEIENIMPPVFNDTGNNYCAVKNYSSMMSFIEGNKSSVCLKKSGKKQDEIDRLTSIKLPDVSLNHEDINIRDVCNGIYKFAVIQKVENEVPTCVVRTFNYIYDSQYIFEGGRIYVVGKKDVFSCKKNNQGEYVNQALLNSVHHWDFSIDKFNGEITKDTKLEFFGEIISELSPSYRAAAIWVFLKEPMLEQITKITNVDFLEEFISILQDGVEISSALHAIFGINKARGNKLFQMLGMNKTQFASVKDILSEGMSETYFSEYGSGCSLSKSIITIVKKMLVNDSSGDISSIDIGTFNSYLDFAIELYEAKKVKRFGTNEFHHEFESLLNCILVAKNVYPHIDVKNLFPILTAIFIDDLLVCASRYDRGRYKRMFNDYFSMVSKLTADEQSEFKPRFKTIEELRTTHDNITLMIEMRNNVHIDEKFKTRIPVWEKWDFEKKEKRNKEGEIKEEALPFVVIHPTCFYDLAREGTLLHHCVKSYGDRVADGQTNIMFIRKADDVNTPFFTVEVSNELVIRQVHGFGNCNASSVEGLPEFIDIWAKKKKLKFNSYNNVLA